MSREFAQGPPVPVTSEQASGSVSKKRTKILFLDPNEIGDWEKLQDTETSSKGIDQTDLNNYNKLLEEADEVLFKARPAKRPRQNKTNKQKSNNLPTKPSKPRKRIIDHNQPWIESDDSDNPDHALDDELDDDEYFRRLEEEKMREDAEAELLKHNQHQARIAARRTSSITNIPNNNKVVKVQRINQIDKQEEPSPDSLTQGFDTISHTAEDEFDDRTSSSYTGSRLGNSERRFGDEEFNSPNSPSVLSEDSVTDGDTLFVDETADIFELRSSAPFIDLPPSSSDLVCQEKYILDAMSVYEVLRRYGRLLRLSPFTLEDFLAALVSNENSSLLTEIHLTLFKALLLEDESTNTFMYSVDVRDSVALTLNMLLDSVTWPALLAEYLVSLKNNEPLARQAALKFTNSGAGGTSGGIGSSSSAPSSSLTSNQPTYGVTTSDLILPASLFSDTLIPLPPDYPFVDIGIRLSVLRGLVSLFVGTGIARTQMLHDSFLPHEDYCRVCQQSGEVLCCDGCTAVFHLNCLNPPLEQIPSSHWLCPICQKMNTPGVTDCGPDAERYGLVHRQELLGRDRFGRIYRYLCRRIVVESVDLTQPEPPFNYASDDQSSQDTSSQSDLDQTVCQNSPTTSTYYYSSIDQVTLLRSRLSLEWEPALCYRIDSLASRLNKEMAVTRQLTSQGLDQLCSDRPTAYRRLESDSNRDCAQDTTLVFSVLDQEAAEARSTLNDAGQDDGAAEHSTDHCSDQTPVMKTKSVSLGCMLEPINDLDSLLEPFTDHVVSNLAAPVVNALTSDPSELGAVVTHDGQNYVVRNNEGVLVSIPRQMDKPSDTRTSHWQDSLEQASTKAAQSLKVGDRPLLAYRLSDEGGWRQWTNVYTTGVWQSPRPASSLTEEEELQAAGPAVNVCLSRLDALADKDRRRVLAAKFTLNQPTIDRWWGSYVDCHLIASLYNDLVRRPTGQSDLVPTPVARLGSLVETVKMTLCRLEAQIPLAFYIPNWRLFRMRWLTKVINATRVSQLAYALACLEASLSPLIFHRSWTNSIGHLSFDRSTAAQRDEEKRQRAYERASYLTGPLSNQTLIQTFNPRPIRHTVWKARGEEYRRLGGDGWSWISSTRRRRRDDPTHMSLQALIADRRQAINVSRGRFGIGWGVCPDQLESQRNQFPDPLLAPNSTSGQIDMVHPITGIPLNLNLPRRRLVLPDDVLRQTHKQPASNDNDNEPASDKVELDEPIAPPVLNVSNCLLQRLHFPPPIDRPTPRDGSTRRQRFRLDSLLELRHSTAKRGHQLNSQAEDAIASLDRDLDELTAGKRKQLIDRLEEAQRELDEARLRRADAFKARRAIDCLLSRRQPQCQSLGPPYNWHRMRSSPSIRQPYARPNLLPTTYRLMSATGGPPVQPLLPVNQFSNRLPMPSYRSTPLRPSRSFANRRMRHSSSSSTTSDSDGENQSQPSWSSSQVRRSTRRPRTARIDPDFVADFEDDEDEEENGDSDNEGHCLRGLPQLDGADDSDSSDTADQQTVDVQSDAIQIPPTITGPTVVEVKTQPSPTIIPSPQMASGGGNGLRLVRLMPASSSTGVQPYTVGKATAAGSDSLRFVLTSGCKPTDLQPQTVIVGPSSSQQQASSAATNSSTTFVVSRLPGTTNGQVLPSQIQIVPMSATSASTEGVNILTSTALQQQSQPLRFILSSNAPPVQRPVAPPITSNTVRAPFTGQQALSSSSLLMNSRQPVQLIRRPLIAPRPSPLGRGVVGNSVAYRRGSPFVTTVSRNVVRPTTPLFDPSQVDKLDKAVVEAGRLVKSEEQKVAQIKQELTELDQLIAGKQAELRRQRDLLKAFNVESTHQPYSLTEHLRHLRKSTHPAAKPDAGDDDDKMVKLPTRLPEVNLYTNQPEKSRVNLMTLGQDDQPSNLFRWHPDHLRSLILSAGRRELPCYDVEKKRLVQVSWLYPTARPNFVEAWRYRLSRLYSPPSPETATTATSIALASLAVSMRTLWHAIKWDDLLNDPTGDEVNIERSVDTNQVACLREPLESDALGQSGFVTRRVIGIQPLDRYWRNANYLVRLTSKRLPNGSYRFNTLSRRYNKRTSLFVDDEDDGINSDSVGDDVDRGRKNRSVAAGKRSSAAREDPDYDPSEEFGGRPKRPVARRRRDQYDSDEDDDDEETSGCRRLRSPEVTMLDKWVPADDLQLWEIRQFFERYLPLSSDHPLDRFPVKINSYALDYNSDPHGLEQARQLSCRLPASELNPPQRSSPPEKETSDSIPTAEGTNSNDLSPLPPSTKYTGLPSSNLTGQLSFVGLGDLEHNQVTRQRFAAAPSWRQHRYVAPPSKEVRHRVRRSRLHPSPALPIQPPSPDTLAAKAKARSIAASLAARASVASRKAKLERQALEQRVRMLKNQLTTRRRLHSQLARLLVEIALANAAKSSEEKEDFNIDSDLEFESEGDSDLTSIEEEESDRHHNQTVCKTRPGSPSLRPPPPRGSGRGRLSFRRPRRGSHQQSGRSLKLYTNQQQTIRSRGTGLSLRRRPRRPRGSAGLPRVVSDYRTLTNDPSSSANTSPALELRDEDAIAPSHDSSSPSPTNQPSLVVQKSTVSGQRGRGRSSFIGRIRRGRPGRGGRAGSRIITNSAGTRIEAPVSDQQVADDAKPPVQLYCCCKTPYNPECEYIGCDLCHDWFHFECVNLKPEDTNTLGDSWHCPDCRRAEQDASCLLYCSCQTPYEPTRVYIACDECDEWYHAECVGLTPQSASEHTGSFFCPKCSQGRSQLPPTSNQLGDADVNNEGDGANFDREPVKKKKRGRPIGKKSSSANDQRLTVAIGKKLAVLVKRMQEHKLAWPFLQTPDPERFPNIVNIEDCKSLGTISTSLNAGSYHTLGDFAFDMNSLFTLARSLYLRGSPELYCTEVMEAFFVKQMRELKSSALKPKQRPVNTDQLQ